MIGLLLLVSIPSGANGKPLPSQADKLGLRTVVIDAGHGGKDPGTISLDKKTREKDIALDIAIRLRDKIRRNYPSVKVIMTRSTDVFIPLNTRADIANKNNADLFISIHVNSAANRSARGYSIHALGQSRDKNRDLFQNNLELSKRENSVILLEEDYSTTYEGFDPNDPESFIFFNLMQSAHLEHSLMFADEVNNSLLNKAIGRSRGISQDPFLVLWRTTMPSVLIEVGFMSNQTDLQVLRKESGRASIAEGIYQGFVSFKKKYDKSMNIPDTPPLYKDGGGDPSSTEKQVAKEGDEEGDPYSSQVEKNEGVEVQDEGESGVLYGTQVLASSRKMKPTDPFFKGYPVEIVEGNGLYRYVLSPSSSLQKARQSYQKIRSSFPGCWMVKVENGKTERVN